LSAIEQRTRKEMSYQRFESARRLSLFGLSKPNTQIKEGLQLIVGVYIDTTERISQNTPSRRLGEEGHEERPRLLRAPARYILEASSRP
jgi:hypothetical protein